VRINGLVQGVGFRPTVYRLAHRYGVVGYVANDSHGVTMQIEGVQEDVEALLRAIPTELPPLARINEFDTVELAPTGAEIDFTIRDSVVRGHRRALITPDSCVCQDCLAELFDPDDRRHLYPFINCTNCGPRYTIVTDVPYDRHNTTMAAFTMCPQCQAEYDDPLSRRFHAQPNACWQCGPRLSLRDATGREIARDNPVGAAVEALLKGRIVAIKGLGGFHLACCATSDDAVRRLRGRKRRDQKPLAIMSADLDSVDGYALLTASDKAVLTAAQRPICLVPKRPDSAISELVAPNSKYFGVMLPYTPVHYLLFRDNPFLALVMTSGNVSEEPIAKDIADGLKRLSGIADYYLTNDRDIFCRADDSVVRMLSDEPVFLRRSRGYVPVPVFLRSPVKKSMLGVGAELKNTVCLVKDDKAFVSQHIGDLKNVLALQFFEQAIDHLRRILEIEPAAIACDLHPGYLSSRYAANQGNVPVVRVQHHHAHIASVLAETGEQGPVIGVACDGTGLGDDGAMWGCEFLVATKRDYQRRGHLEYVALPGGDKAVEEPYRMALSHLVNAFGDDVEKLDLPFLRAIEPEKRKIVLQMIARRVNSPSTSSLGRLFDAASALVGVCEAATFEGQPAIEFEAVVRSEETGVYPWAIAEVNGRFVVDPKPIIRALVEDVSRRVEPPIIAARFHNAVVAFITEMCVRLREATSIETVALSGGVFQNDVLARRLVSNLLERGFKVLVNRHVPPNDGGISLGQVAVANELL